jgi:hypothetical protein
MHLLLLKYLNSVKMFEAPNDNGADKRTPAQIERDAIQVESHQGRTEKEAEGDDDQSSESEEDEDEDEDEDGEENEEEDESDENETDEAKAARIAKEKEDRRQSRIQKRIDKLTASNKNFEAEVKRLKQQLEAKPIEGVTDEDIERMAEERADKKLKAQLLDKAQKEFDRLCDKLETAAAKIDPKFTTKVSEMVEELGAPIPSAMMSIIGDLDNENGGAVLNYLTENIEEAEELYAMSERRMTQKLIRISDKLKANEKPARNAKPRSNAPDPVRPIQERAVNNDMNLTGKESMEDFARKRAKQVEERRKTRGY